MAHGRTGGWLLAAETISAGQTTRPPEIIIDTTSEEIRGHTSLSTALVQNKHLTSFALDDPVVHYSRGLIAPNRSFYQSK